MNAQRLRGRTLAVCLLCLTAAFATLRATADEPAPIDRTDPEQMLSVATDRLLEVSREARAYAKQDPERYYAAVEEILDQVLDTHYFARGVMATYASARLYRSLESEAEKQAFRDRVDRFEEAIKRVFMVKYSDALLAFEGERIELVAEPDAGGDPGRARVSQQIFDNTGSTYRVQYTLRRDDEGKWLVINVVVEDVNLGQIYRNQFAAAVEQHGGDVDYVVDHWLDIMTTPEAGAAEASSEGSGDR